MDRWATMRGVSSCGWWNDHEEKKTCVTTQSKALDTIDGGMGLERSKESSKRFWSTHDGNREHTWAIILSAEAKPASPRPLYSLRPWQFLWASTPSIPYCTTTSHFWLHNHTSMYQSQSIHISWWSFSNFEGLSPMFCLRCNYHHRKCNTIVEYQFNCCY